MARLRKTLPAFPGTGQLRSRSFVGEVTYEILGDPSGLKFGPLRLRGSLNTTPDVAEQLFRDGEGVLVLEDGASFRLTMLGHSTGEPTTYFEMRV